MATDTSLPKTKLDRLVRLYPKVAEKETPLPRSWSAKDKYTYIGLSQNNLRVHYKGWCRLERNSFSSLALALLCYVSVGLLVSLIPHLLTSFVTAPTCLLQAAGRTTKTPRQ